MILSLLLISAVTLPTTGSHIACSTILTASEAEQSAYVLGFANAANAFLYPEDKVLLRSPATLKDLVKRTDEVCRKDHALPYAVVFTAAIFQARYPTISAEYFLLYWHYLARNEGLQDFVDIIDVTDFRMQTDAHSVRLVILKELFRQKK